MANTNTVQANLIEQLSQFPLRGFMLVRWEENAIKVSRGFNGAIIRYNAGTDLYDVIYYSGTEQEPEEAGYYCEDLGNVLSHVRSMPKVKF